MNLTPRIWNMPHNRNPLFVGRADELYQLHQTFGIGGFAAQQEQGVIIGGPLGLVMGRRDVVALTQTIAGLGGIGKTSLATEFCYKFQNEYDVVWWLRAQESTTLASDYAALAVKLDAQFATEPNLPALIDFVREWLRVNGRWLLIFDNANAPEEIRVYLPPVGSGHILITSREAVWDDVGKMVALPTLPRNEFIHFLIEYTGDPNRDAANALAQELGDFPLALEHARAYVKQSRSSLAHYLELYRTRRAELWRETNTPLNYHATIATTWDISFAQAAAQSPASADLLNLCAFFAPDDIPLDVIINAAHLSLRGTKQSLSEQFAQTLSDPLALDNAIAALRHYSLIERKENNLSVHRLVQAVTRERMDEPARKQWAEAAVRIVNDAYPGDVTTNVESWKICARLLQHGLAATEHAEIAATTITPEQTARLLNQMGLYLKGRAQYQDAKTLYERALAIDEKQFGREHLNVARDVNNLGSVLKDLGDLAGAKVYYERALAIDEKNNATENSAHATHLNNLGMVLKDLGDLAGAKVYLERALAIFEKQLGAEHPNVGVLVNNLGSVLQDLGDLAGAKVYYERALAIDEKQFGREHPNVARDVNNLGMVLKALGDLAGAKVYLERALAIDEKQFGREHPNVARDVNNLGMLYAKMGDKETARMYLERALKIFQKFLGDEHPNTRTVKRNLEGLGGGIASG